jgi:hypothetical protein
MFKKVLLAGALLLAPVLAYGASPSTDLSVQIVPAAPPSPTPPPPSSGIACDIGPNYTGSIPAAAQAAGFTHCAANYDFTNVAYANPATWLDCQGASRPQWTFAYGNCSHIFMTTDGGIQVLDLEWPPSDYGQYTSTSIQTSNPSNQTDIANALFSIPTGKYIEVVSRVTSESESTSTCSSNCILADAWSWMGNGNTGIEWDFIELYGPTSNVGTSGMGYGGDGMNAYHSGLWNAGHLPGYDPTVYHTYGIRVATDGVGNGNLATCLYFDGNLIDQTQGGSTYQCANGNWTPASTQPGRNFLILTVGPQGGGPNYGANADFYVQSFRVWECPGYATGECNSTTAQVTNGGALLRSP